MELGWLAGKIKRIASSQNLLRHSEHSSTNEHVFIINWGNFQIQSAIKRWMFINEHLPESLFSNEV